MTSSAGDAVPPDAGVANSSSSSSDDSSLASFGAALEEELALQAHDDAASAPVAAAPAPADSGGELQRKRARDDEVVDAAREGEAGVRAPGAWVCARASFAPHNLTRG
jgi:hypothetical protein